MRRVNQKESASEDNIELAVNALLTCPRIADAAKQCGLSRTTLWRMSQDPSFQYRLKQARTKLSEEIVGSLLANSLAAIETLRRIMSDKQTAPATRVTAASKLIDMSLRAKQQLDVELRVTAVEWALKRRKQENS